MQLEQLWNKITNFFSDAISYLIRHGIFNITIAFVSGFALYISLRLILKLIIKKTEITILKKESHRIALFFSLMLTFSLSKISFFTHYGIGILWVFIIFKFYRIFEYVIVEYILITKKKKYIPRILRDIIKGIIFVILTLFLLKTLFDFSLTNIAITSAAVTAVIAFALQDTFINLIAGISISVEKPFEIGDWIKVKNDIIGEVIQTSWRTTRLLTMDRDLYVIPNREISNSEFFNFYKPQKKHGITLKIGVSYDHAPNPVKKIILSILNNVEGIVEDPEPRVRLVNYNNSSMDYEIRYWITNYPDNLAIQDNVLSQIWYAFKRENIVIPFPIRTVEFKHKKVEYLSTRPYGLFKKCPIFEKLDDNALTEIINDFKRNFYGKGEYVLKYDEEAVGLFVIESGSLEVISRDKFNKKRFVTTISEGDFFGELSLITGSKTQADVRVTEDAYLYFEKREKFKELVNKFPELLTALSDMADARIDEIMRYEEAEEEAHKSKPEQKKTILKKFFDYFDN